jgi:hypothetical protein
MATQDNWCFCTKCYELFYNGFLLAGVCPVGQQHSPLQSDSPTGAYSSWNLAPQVASSNPPSQGGDGGVCQWPGRSIRWWPVRSTRPVR